MKRSAQKKASLPPRKGGAVEHGPPANDRPVEERTVRLDVGKDGRLWAKVHGGQWERIVTEAAK